MLYLRLRYLKECFYIVLSWKHVFVMYFIMACLSKTFYQTLYPCIMYRQQIWKWSKSMLRVVFLRKFKKIYISALPIRQCIPVPFTSSDFCHVCGQWTPVGGHRKRCCFLHPSVTQWVFFVVLGDFQPTYAM